LAIRILVPIDALPGKGNELARVRLPRHDEVRAEAGCEQFDLFQNVENPDKLLLVERWTDQASLDAHAVLNQQRPPLGTELRAGGGGKAEHYTAE